MEQMITQLLKRLDLFFEREMSKHMSEYGLTGRQADLLAFVIDRVQKGEKLCTRDIERELQLSHAATAGVLSRVADKGFITFETSDRDNRYRYISITDKSRAMCEQLNKSMEYADKTLLKSLSDDERTRFQSTLIKLLDDLEGNGAKKTV